MFLKNKTEVWYKIILKLLNENKKQKISWLIFKIKYKLRKLKGIGIKKCKK